ncbi:MAG TPA: FAD-dependent monooxygenase [Vicinamibacterales bacterium]
MFDVIVAGAGPAGATAALVLARGGARVLLLDRARFPRSKLCGDTLNPGTLAILRRQAVSAPIEARALRLDGMVVTGERRVAVSCRYGPGVHALSIARCDLDAGLAAAAVNAGARFEEGVAVRSALVDAATSRVRGVIIAGRDGCDVRVPAPFVIAADGRRSSLAIPLGLARQPPHPRRWAIGAYFAGVEGLQTFGEMHVRRRRYIGVAPVPGGAANVCLVVPAPVRIDDPAALLLDAIRCEPALRDRFAAARLIARPAVLGPLAVDAPQAGMDGLVLAGDAAGFIDPITGDGLRFAVRGGELAAEALLAALAGRLARPHVALRRARRREFGGKWRFNRLIRRVVASGATVEAAGLIAAAAPWALRRAIGFAGDVPA